MYFLVWFSIVGYSLGQPITVEPHSQCTCGIFSPLVNSDDVRIVGGFVAQAHSLPYQVGLWSKLGSHPFCGGTLISPSHVLTAAHCAVSLPASQVKVSVGDVNFRVTGDEVEFIQVRKSIKHPKYNDYTMDNDFAIMELVKPVTVSPKVGFACLPMDTSQAFVGSNLTVSGWGTTQFRGKMSPFLKEAFVTGMTNEECMERAYEGITENMLCAGTANFDTDSCQGDSGGPLVANINNKTVVVGVVSFGEWCAKAPYPGVYARVTSQIQWILQNSEAQNCQK